MYSDKIIDWQQLYRQKLHELRDQYYARKPVFLLVIQRAENLIRKDISDCQIKCDVTSRVKGFESFRNKFRKKFIELYSHLQEATDEGKGELYCSRLHIMLNDPFSVITDVAGIRCVGLFSKELYPFYPNSDSEPNDFFKLKKIITNRFDNAPKMDAIPSPYPDEKLSPTQGYRSIHYDLCLKNDSIVSVLEQSIISIPFELQIRTYSQHLINDVSHYLNYKKEYSLFPSEVFNDETIKLQNELSDIQNRIDKLFEASKEKYNALLTLVKQGNIEELLGLPITPETLKIYALYEFVILKNLSLDSIDLPTRISDAKFVDLWLNELSDGLRHIGFTTIRDVRISTQRGVGFIIHYLNFQHLLARKSIFKKNDLTDVLSKCLLFSEEKLRECYPILPETKKNIEAFHGPKP